MTENSNQPEAVSPAQPLVAAGVVARYSGPLPPAAELAKYNDASPGAADRIISMAEAEQRYRHAISHKAESNKLIGACMGFAVLLSVIALTGFAIYLQQPWVATVLLGIVGTGGLLISRRPRKG
ncbi:hypothetical protein FACS1894186_6720 [Alphaproteobacteria bacterium]|nr:hypothetical protein FACS1894186_6720 [Alphaproteobacteria bacterium]